MKYIVSNIRQVCVVLLHTESDVQYYVAVTYEYSVHEQCTIVLYVYNMRTKHSAATCATV
jgi:hypothetical protein